MFKLLFRSLILVLGSIVIVFGQPTSPGAVVVAAQVAAQAAKEAAAAAPPVQTQQITTQFGRPIGDKLHSLTVGQRGPMVTLDTQFIEEMSHFVRARIPERVVHPKGNGAFGKFVVTNPTITQYSKAKVFESVGKETEVAVRFSVAFGHQGIADAQFLSQFGFAAKFYTEEGNWDLLSSHSPIFFIRDPILFPSFVASTLGQPQDNLLHTDNTLDFVILMPETLNIITFLLSDAGIPNGYRRMDAHSIHPFKLVNSNGSHVYAKFHWLSNNGIANLTLAQAAALNAADPDSFGHDLFNNIASGNFPSWGLWIQVITEEQARSFPFNPFDVTKVWSTDTYPLIEVGKLTLDTNPDNHFAQVEQAAYGPGNLVPGIETTLDRTLNGRMFAYADAQRYRLGVNYDEIPVNRPRNKVLAITQRDGAMRVDGNYGSTVAYYPNSYSNIKDNPKFLDSNSTVPDTTIFRYEDLEEEAYDYIQPREQFNSFSAQEKQNVINNAALVLTGASNDNQQRFIQQLTLLDPAYGAGVSAALSALLS